MPHKPHITILTGGPSNEYDISIKTSREIAKIIPRKKYRVSILALKKKSSDILSQLKKLHTDLAFIAIHGKFGEDGTLQAILESLGIPYTGSGILASAWAMDKARCSRFASQSNIITPNLIQVHSSEQRREILKKAKKIGYPLVIKPNQSGSSIGISIVGSQKELNIALRRAFAECASVVIEQYIKGREFSCAVLGNEGEDKICLPPIEIITNSEKFFNYKAKYFSKKVQEICPALISPALDKKIRTVAIKIHELLGCDGLTRSDFIWSAENNRLYFLEINTVPGQTKMSLAPKEAAAAGIDAPTFLDMQIALAFKKMKHT